MESSIRNIKDMIQQVLQQIELKQKELEKINQEYKQKILIINEELDDLEETLECLQDDYIEYHKI